MRKILLLLLCVTVTLLAYANPITPEEAKNKAEAFMKARHATGKRHVMRLAKKSQQQSTTQNAAYYVFNADAQEGFVVVSGDDRTPAILGFADSGTFDASNIPSNMQAWLDGYAQQLDYLDAHPKAAVAKAPAEEHAAIRPLLKTLWSQGAPYNNLCPMDDNARSVTGCVATAMAQVLYYHKYPAKTTNGIPAYTTTEKNIHVDSIPPTSIDWDNMLYSYNGGETTVQERAVATLMKLCGASVEMDYTNKESGAGSWMVGESMKAYFDYDAATTYIDRSDYRAAEWDEVIYNELAERRPVYYAGSSVGGGHAFVIDGYDSNGLYHVNWGWGGYSNGYFLLSILDPDSNSGIGASSSTDGYSYYQEAIIGAQPNTGFAPIIEARMNTYDIKAEKTTFTKNREGKFPVTFKATIYNTTGATYTFDIGVGVYSTDNELVYEESLWNGVELSNNWGWSFVEMEVSVPTLPDGHYLITPISKESSSTKWLQNSGAQSSFLTATISGNTLTLKAPTIALNGEMQTTGNMEAGSKVSVATTITNNGTLFNDILYLRVNGEDVGGRHFDIDADETNTLEMSFKPEDTGTYTLALGYVTWEWDDREGNWNETFHEVASTNVTIIAARSYSLAFSDGKVTNATHRRLINDSKADIAVTISNTGTYNYYDDIMTIAFKKGEDNDYWYHTSVFTPIDIPAGTSQRVNIRINDLDDGFYWFIIIYKTDGAYTSYNDKKKSYRALSDYTVSVPTAIETTKADSRNQSNDIYDLQGRKVAQPTKGGLYIVNGRKVVK